MVDRDAAGRHAAGQPAGPEIQRLRGGLVGHAGDPYPRLIGNRVVRTAGPPVEVKRFRIGVMDGERKAGLPQPRSQRCPERAQAEEGHRRLVHAPPSSGR